MIRAGLAALSVSAIALSAHAATTLDAADYAALTDLNQLNLIVLNNMSGGDDVEGKTFVGGNLTNAATYGIGRIGVYEPTSTYETLTVGGNVTGSVNITPGPNVSGPYGATIGGSAGSIDINISPASLEVGGTVGNFNPQKGDTYTPDAGKSVAAGIASTTATFTTDLKDLSAALAGLTPTGAYNGADPNNVTLTAKTTDAAGFAVIDITAAELESAASIVYDFSAGIPVIINVSGTTASYSVIDNANNNNSEADSASVLWNFEGATNVTLNRQLVGGVLAPYATLSNNSPIDGSVAVYNFNQGGEVHLATFVPEPGTWWMMIGGVGLVGGALRARRRRAVAFA